MAEIRITGFEDLEREVKQTRELVESIHKMQPEKDALVACINAMQAAIEDVIVAYEAIDGQTEISKKARHAMNAAQMLKDANKEFKWHEFVFPEEMEATTARRLVKRPAPAKKGKRK
jgi:hypothetical protein